MLRRGGIVVLFASLLGCGTQPLYPVSGEILFEDGKRAVELAGGSVECDLIGGRTTARGRIEADGTFRISTYQANDGALPGKYRVLVVPPLPVNFDKPPPPDLMDRRFRRYATSGLEITVEAKNNEVTLHVERVKPGDVRPPSGMPGSRPPGPQGPSGSVPNG